MEPSTDLLGLDHVLPSRRLLEQLDRLEAHLLELSGTDTRDRRVTDKHQGPDLLRALLELIWEETTPPAQALVQQHLSELRMVSKGYLALVHHSSTFLRMACALSSGRVSLPSSFIATRKAARMLRSAVSFSLSCRRPEVRP